MQSTKRAADSQLVPGSIPTSETQESLAEDILSELAAMEEEKRAEQEATRQKTADNEWQVVGRGRGGGRTGRGVVVTNSFTGRGSGKGHSGKKGDAIISWLCAFCNTPTGSANEHNRKYCEKLFRPPPVHELSRARCAFCGHGHLFTECPILFERGGIHWLPQRYLEMCEIMGYPTIKIGERRVLRMQGILPTAVPVGPSSDVSDGSSQGSDATSLSLSSANELSLASTNPDMQQLVSFITSHHNRITEQIGTLNSQIKRLVDGQEALSEVGSATVLAVSELRGSVKEQLAENKRETEAAMNRTIEQCKEAMRLLNQPASSGDTGVSGPPGAQKKR